MFSFLLLFFFFSFFQFVVCDWKLRIHTLIDVVFIFFFFSLLLCWCLYSVFQCAHCDCKFMQNQLKCVERVDRHRSKMKMFWHICVMMIASLQLMYVRFAFVFSIPINARFLLFASVILYFSSVLFFSSSFVSPLNTLLLVSWGRLCCIFTCDNWLGTALKYFSQNSRYMTFFFRCD